MILVLTSGTSTNVFVGFGLLNCCYNLLACTYKCTCNYESHVSQCCTYVGGLFDVLATNSLAGIACCDLLFSDRCDSAQLKHLMEKIR